MPPTHPSGVASDDAGTRHGSARRRDNVLEAVAQIADLVGSGAAPDEVIPQSLQRLGEATGVSRCYLFEVIARPSGRTVASQRHEWVAPGVTPQIDAPELQRLDLEEAGFGRWVRTLRAGDPIAGDVDGFPETERPLLAQQDIRSLVVQPVFAGARWWGFLGFDACEHPVAWERVELDALRIAARSLGGLLHQHEREAALQLARKMDALGRMAGGAAHDFNNLLAILSGEVDLLSDDLSRSGLLTPERAEAVSMLVMSLERARALTRSLLDFSHRREGRPALVAVGDALRRAAPLLRQAAGPGVAFTLDTATDAAPVRIDPVQLDQVVMNLVSNARDAMPEGGSLALRVRMVADLDEPALSDGVVGGPWTLLTCRDTGHGMSPEVLDRVFEPFFTTKAPDRGTGLGLATVYAAVVAASGRIVIHSVPGEGTEVRVYLPLGANTPPRGTATAAED